ncbi:phosphoserine phosphatase [Rhodobium orientis]|uniref:Phosphoserine phosphatase n=1 Tax=Rhodobium orientis TaxID=34017 RepID=A0A327JIS3_9HYPH|nr:phosphoserine phosphatase SerB [Rhodobium orientis]MBB4305389.1 phosphoserine phosphatase [Rhodobium orientis]MBK5950077.1 phosphoserine phosphatase SerB [Rhodobium orientis]RAI25254.1 phosphoserine phosphatase SerB [Rhodobium orientis]
MPIVATLIANPARPYLDESLAEAARSAVGGGAPDWLASGIACDIALAADADPIAARSAIVEALSGAPVDVAIVETTDRRKKLFLADMDSTMIEQECIDELAAEMKIKDQVAAITEAAMRGELDFAGALKERVALLKGLDTALFKRIILERISLTAGARTLVRTMRANGVHCALVSGGFTVFTQEIARLVGFNEHHANRLVIDGGRLSGHVVEPILGAKAKLDRLRALRDRLGLLPRQTLAVGDGANDLMMVEDAGLGVAYHAKPTLAEAADIRIDHGDLTALLYAQGYRQSEFTH